MLKHIYHQKNIIYNMKHLKNFENYTEKDVRDMLEKSQKKQDIEIKTSIDNVMSNLIDTNDVKLIGTIKGFIISEGEFISEGDKKRMKEYIQEFKKLGLDVSKVEKLLPKYEKYTEISYDLNSYFDALTEYDYKQITKLNDELDSLENDVEEFETEIRILAKKAKELL